MTTAKARGRKAKRARKTPRDSSAPALVPQPHGGALQRGNPGNRGGGRKPSAFVQAMGDVLDQAQAAAVLRKIISGDILEQIATDEDGEAIYGQTKNRDRLAAIEFCAAYFVGRPVQRMEHTGAEGEPIEVQQLGNLSDAELVALERILRKAAGLST